MPAGCKRGERRGDCSVAGRNHRVSFIRHAGRRFSLAATMILHSHSFFAIRRARLPWTAEPGSGVVRLDGIEPTTPAWKAEVLPLNYSRRRDFKASPRRPAVKPSFRGTPPIRAICRLDAPAGRPPMAGKTVRNRSCADGLTTP